MWILLLDTRPDIGKDRFLVFHDNNGTIDKVLQTKGKTHWTSYLLNYVKIDVLNPTLLTKSMTGDPSYYQILHTFDSTDPVAYIKSLQDTNPELFI